MTYFEGGLTFKDLSLFVVNLKEKLGHALSALSKQSWKKTLQLSLDR